MIYYLSLLEILDLHSRLLETSGGTPGLRDFGLLQSAVAQPQMMFGGQDLYLHIADKAVALGFSLIMNHPFVDGNKRTAHASMEAFLVLNQQEITADVDEQEKIILAVASGQLNRSEFINWLQQNTQFII
jgi:death-on-curing protein